MRVVDAVSPQATYVTYHPSLSLLVTCKLACLSAWTPCLVTMFLTQEVLFPWFLGRQYVCIQGNTTVSSFLEYLFLLQDQTWPLVPVWNLYQTIPVQKLTISGYSPLIVKHHPQNYDVHGLGTYIKDRFPCSRDPPNKDSDFPMWLLFIVQPRLMNWHTLLINPLMFSIQ